MIRRTEAELDKIRELKERYEREGFVVVADPGPEAFPFDLPGFRPDLLVRAGEERYLVKVRTLGDRLPVDRMIDVARAVKQQPGWRFYVVTANDVDEDAPGIADPLPSWPHLRRRATDAIRLAQGAGTPEAAVLALWSAAEGVLRKTAVAAAIPVERLPVARVIPQLYSLGELTLEQFDRLKQALAVRKRLIHGYEAKSAEIARASRDLVDLLGELLNETAERAA